MSVKDFYGRICGVDNSYIQDGLLSIPESSDCKSDTNSPACQQQVVQQNIRSDLSNQKYLYYTDITNPFALGGVCVSYCPGSMQGAKYCPPELEQDELVPNVCIVKRSAKNYPSSLSHKLLLSDLEYRSTLFRCLPAVTETTHNGTTISKKNSLIVGRLNQLNMFLSELWADVSRSWRLILVSGVIAILFGFFFLLMVRMYAEIFVWFAIGLLFVALLGGGIMGLASSPSESTSLYSLSAWMPRAPIYASIIACIASLVYAIFIGVFFQRIKRATGIFREAANAVAALPALLILPFTLFILIVVFLIFWMQTALNLWSAVGETSVHGSTTVVSWSYSHRFMFFYHLFGFFWVSQFLLGYLHTSTAGAVATWYWTPTEEKYVTRLQQPVLRAAMRPVLYHIGSIALGRYLHVHGSNSIC